MYWSEYDGITGSIHKATMSGEGRHCLVNKIGKVISITSDYDNGLIYWSTLTPNSGYIESIDLEGRRLNRIASITFGYPSAISYFKVMIYKLKIINICLYIYIIFDFDFRAFYIRWIGLMEVIFKLISIMVQ